MSVVFYLSLLQDGGAIYFDSGSYLGVMRIDDSRFRNVSSKAVRLRQQMSTLNEWLEEARRRLDWSSGVVIVSPFATLHYVLTNLC